MLLVHVVKIRIADMARTAVQFDCCHLRSYQIKVESRIRKCALLEKRMGRGGGDWRIHRLFRVAASDIPLLIEETKARLSGAGRRESYDNILRALVRAGRFFAEDITGIPWTEIDFPENVAYANNIILTALQDRAMRL